MVCAARMPAPTVIDTAKGKTTCLIDPPKSGKAHQPARGPHQACLPI
jgi:hypothetical protein